TIEHLLDDKEGNEQTADRDRYVEGCHRGHRRHPQALKAVEEIEVTEIDHAKGDCEHHRAIEQFEEQPLLTAKRFGKNGEIEMIVASRCRGDAREYAIDEETHCGFLRPKERVPDGARNDVGQHHHAKTGDGEATQDHQDVFEWIERTPFQM